MESYGRSRVYSSQGTAMVCRTGIVVLTALLAGFLATQALAQVTFSGTGLGNDPGETNTASVVFNLSISGTTTDLVVTLSNNPEYTPNDNPDILTTVFFSIAGDPTLTKISGMLAAGSSAVENGTNLTIVGGDIGGSWCYATGFTNAPGGATQGIGSAGLGLFGPGDVFPGAALPGDSNVPNGIGGGLTETIPDGGTHDGLNGQPFIQHSAVFTLGAVPASFSLSDISDVSFQYGTTLGSEPNIPGILVPEPSAMGLSVVGLLLLGLVRRIRR